MDNKILFLLLLVNLSMFSQTSSIDYVKNAGFKKNKIIVNNDTIVFISSNLESEIAKPTILFLQGSLPLPIIFKDKESTNTLIPFDIKPYTKKFNFVIIARKGIPLIGSYDEDSKGYYTRDRETPILYIQNDNLIYRAFQAKEVVNYLYKQKWVKKDSIYVIGHSEGYRVAAKISENNKKIAKLVCMSADPFNRITEEINKERYNYLIMDKDSISQIKISRLINDYKNISKNIEMYKSDIELYNWASYNSELTFNSFKKFENPILITYGTNDISSFHNDLLPFLLKGKKLTVKAFPDLDHNYFKNEFDKNGKNLENSYHWDDVFKSVVEWLLSKE